MTKTAAISGLHIRMDVPTKCRIVGTILSKSFSTTKEQNQFIEALASQSFVNPVTIKLWCGKYQNTWKIGQQLPNGTMSFTFATIPETKLASAYAQLLDLRERLSAMTDKVQTSYYQSLKATDVQPIKTPREILNELIKG